MTREKLLLLLFFFFYCRILSQENFIIPNAVCDRWHRPPFFIFIITRATSFLYTHMWVSWMHAHIKHYPRFPRLIANSNCTLNVLGGFGEGKTERERERDPQESRTTPFSPYNIATRTNVSWYTCYNEYSRLNELFCFWFSGVRDRKPAPEFYTPYSGV